jgi:hypothetical protein
MVADMLSRWVSRGAASSHRRVRRALNPGIPLFASSRWIPEFGCRGFKEKSSIPVSVEVDLDALRRSRVQEGE